MSKKKYKTTILDVVKDIQNDGLERMDRREKLAKELAIKDGYPERVRHGRHVPSKYYKEADKLLPKVFKHNQETARETAIDAMSEKNPTGSNPRNIFARLRRRRKNR